MIIVGDGRSPVERDASPRSTLEAAVGGNGMVAVEILGQSVLQRTIAELKKAEFEEVSVYTDDFLSSEVDGRFDGASPLLSAWQSVAGRLRDFVAGSDDPVLILELNAYVELDFADLRRFHQESGTAVTRLAHESGPVGLWVVNPAIFPDTTELRSVLDQISGAEYCASGYLNRLETPADLRRLINDGLASRCQCRPVGFEVKPGIWMAPDALVQKAARIVAPAFIGRGVSIADECLITRGSNIESDCEVDYGTTIESSSILSNTYVGIGLDLSHSIAQGSNLLNLQHDVVLHISDPAVMRQNKKLAAADPRSLLNFGIGEAMAT